MRKSLILAALMLALPASAQNGPKFGKNGGVGAADSSVATGEPTGGTFSISGTTGVATLKGITLPSQTTITTIPGSGSDKGTMVLSAKTVNLQGLLAAYKPIEQSYNGVPGDAGYDAIGYTAFVTNTGTNGGNAERLDYVAGANTTGSGFEVGKSFYAHCGGIQGGQCLSYFGIAQSPTSLAHSWGVYGWEINPINLAGDTGWADRRGALANWTGGGQIVPESHDFLTNTTAGAYNSLYGLMIGHSAAVSSATGYYTQTYNGLLIEPDAIGPGGMGMQVSGALGRTTAGTLPSAAIRIAGGFAQAAIDTRTANFSTGAAMTLGSGQAICYVGNDGCVRYNGGVFSYSVGGGTPWSITNAGHMFVPKDGGVYYPTPNYVGNESDAAIEAVVGSQAAPSTTAGAVGLFQKYSSAQAFNTLAGLAVKSSTATTRATGIYGEGVDTVGGTGTFVEGGRFQGTLAVGANGSAYGAICAAGTNITDVTAPAYLIGCEGEVDNQIGPDAPTFGSFNKDRFSASFVATNGVGGSPRYIVDAAFVVNHYSLGAFRTGVLITDAVTGTAIAATSGTALVSGIDLSLATFSSAAIKTPGFQVGPSGATSAASYSVGATAGVSCAAGTVSLATMVVTNGIITHC